MIEGETSWENMLQAFESMVVGRLDDRPTYHWFLEYDKRLGIVSLRVGKPVEEEK